MQQLLGDRPPDEAFVRELFLQKLPSNVRMVLASARRDTTLAQLAQMADEIMEVATPSISAVHRDARPTPQLSAEMEQLRSEVAGLTNLVKSLTRRRRSPSPHPSRRQLTTDLCWYHQRFGDDARKCQEPCMFKVGKLRGQPLVATGVSGHSHSRLFYITDNSSGLKFLVDTGAQVSVIPCTHFRTKEAQA